MMLSDPSARVKKLLFSLGTGRFLLLNLQNEIFEEKT